jgi:hypothetical protein
MVVWQFFISGAGHSAHSAGSTVMVHEADILLNHSEIAAQFIKRLE